jgi:predicted RNase H-like HicB family nuclease
MDARVYTAYVEYDPESKLYVGIIPSLPGAHSQGLTLDELMENLREVVALCLEEKAARGEPIDDDHFIGVQRIAVSA